MKKALLALLIAALAAAPQAFARSPKLYGPQHYGDHFGSRYHVKQPRKRTRSTQAGRNHTGMSNFAIEDDTSSATRSLSKKAKEESR